MMQFSKFSERVHNELGYLTGQSKQIKWLIYGSYLLYVSARAK